MWKMSIGIVLIIFTILLTDKINIINLEIISTIGSFSIWESSNSWLFKMVKIMRVFKYKNIKLTKKYNEANFVTHSGTFHVDDVISTIFLSKFLKKLI